MEEKYIGRGFQMNFASLIGKTIEEAQNEYGFIRVVSQDGKEFMLTMDNRPDRVNVIVVNGRITAIDGFY